MATNFADVAYLLSCPDDGARLDCAPNELRCSLCARRFPIHANNLAEILPQRPLELPATANPEYRQGYLQTFGREYRYDHSSLAWGAPESVSKSWARKRLRQVAMAEPLITEGTKPGESVLCDIAAGAGYYTLAYAHRFRFVFHCDLSVDNLNYALQKARELGLQNVYFLRADYFAPPFQQSLDRILCMDTLIRGEAHDAALLTSILLSLKPEGSAVVDFHNWWHNPLRRVGLLPENFHSNRSYRRSEVEQLLRQVGIKDYSLRPFLQEFNPDSGVASLVSPAFPAARLVYRFSPPVPKASPVAVRCVAGVLQ